MRFISLYNCQFAELIHGVSKTLRIVAIVRAAEYHPSWDFQDTPST